MPPPPKPIFPGGGSTGFNPAATPVGMERATPFLPGDEEWRPAASSGPGASQAPAREPSDADVPWVDLQTRPRRDREPQQSYLRPAPVKLGGEDTPAPRRSPLKAVLGNRVALLLVLAVVLAAALVPVLLRPRGDAGAEGTSVSDIRRHARDFDGRVVTVRGQVGQVFRVGQGHAYYLHHGADTLIVFTRGVAPTPLDKVTVTGSVVTGEMDGIPRPTLFERPK